MPWSGNREGGLNLNITLLLYGNNLEDQLNHESKIDLTIGTKMSPLILNY